MDPITAFALCKGAYEGIKGCIAVYQDLEKTEKLRKQLEEDAKREAEPR